MASTLKIQFTSTLKYENYFDAFAKADREARKAMGIQLINNIVQGEGGSTARPPILHGTLWGSGSVFFGSQKIYITPGQGGEPTPATSHSEKDGIITIGFNTSYAARYHNFPFNPGPRSQQAGGVTDHYVSKHIVSDSKELLKFYASLIKKRTGG